MLFNNFEQFKYESYKNKVNIQTDFNKLIDEKDRNLSDIINKYNRLDEEYEKTNMC